MLHTRPNPKSKYFILTLKPLYVNRVFILLSVKTGSVYLLCHALAADCVAAPYDIFYYITTRSCQRLNILIRVFNKSEVQGIIKSTMGQIYQIMFNL